MHSQPFERRKKSFFAIVLILFIQYFLKSQLKKEHKQGKSGSAPIVRFLIGPSYFLYFSQCFRFISTYFFYKVYPWHMNLYMLQFLHVYRISNPISLLTRWRVHFFVYICFWLVFWVFYISAFIHVISTKKAFI